MDDLEQQRRHFESVSDKYFTARQSSNHLLLKDLMWDCFLEGKGSLVPEGGDVLEAMCGYSEGKTILESRLPVRFNYSGFDFSRPLVDLAQKKYPDARIFVGDATQFDEIEAYDLIILIGGLHHVFRHTDDVLVRMHRALKPRGHFINLEPTQDNRLFKKIREHVYAKNGLFDADTEQAYDLSELNRAYRRAGFAIVDQMYPGLLSYVLYYNPDAFPALNHGGTKAVRALFSIDRIFFRSRIGRYFSFATLSLLAK